MPGRRPHWSFRGLLDVHSGYGLPARRTAKRPVFLEGFDGFVTSTAAPIATGWSDRVAGWELHPLKIVTFHDAQLGLTPSGEPAAPRRARQKLLDAIAQQRVADRPDRFEPRMTKRRPKNFNRLTKPRKEIKLDMIKGFIKI